MKQRGEQNNEMRDCSKEGGREKEREEGFADEAFGV